MKRLRYIYAVRWTDGHAIYTECRRKHREGALAEAEWLRVHIDMRCWVRRMRK